LIIFTLMFFIIMRSI